jgi:hypothetical protein
VSVHVIYFMLFISRTGSEFTVKGSEF